MFTIYGGKREFAQWDLDHLVTCPCMQKGDKVFFYANGKNRSTTAYERDGEIVADVPNALLQFPGSIRIDLGSGLECHIDCRTEIAITEREKPDGYCCTDNSNLTKKYITSMPQNLTEAEKAQARENIGVAAGGGGKSVQTDWNQMDETAADFLKNKPFGDVPNVILEEQEIAFDPENGMIAPLSTPIQDGDLLSVTFDGTEYICDAQYNPALMGITFGNLAVIGEAADSGEPFLGAYVDGIVAFITTDEASHTVGITVFDVTKIPTRYLTAQTVFYGYPGGDTPYIFTDSNATVRATAYDVLDALKYGSISIHALNNGILVNAAVPYIVQYFGTYCSLICHGGTLHTAEYTPKA